SGSKSDSIRGTATALAAPSFDSVCCGSPQGPTTAGQLILSRNGRFAYWPHMFSLDALAINSDTGSMTRIQSLPPSNNKVIVGAAMTASGRFLYGSNFGGEIWSFKIDLDAGTFTAVSDTPTIC